MDSNDEKVSDAELSKLYKIKKTLLKMISDRGYLVSTEDREISFDDFKMNFKGRKKSMTIFSTKEAEPTNSIYVEFIHDPKLGVEQISLFTEKIRKENISCGIMVISGSITPLAKQKFRESNELLHIEYFEEKELVVNITEHELVPKHILLSDEEKKTLLKKYRLEESQLPKILTTDPVAKYLGLRRGQVVKIIRASETAGRYITYIIAQ